jgi:hypothetical protein
MSGGKSISEVLEHSTIIDILSILVYAYFGYVSYSNLGYGKSELTSISTDPTVIAVQLAGLLVIINIFFLITDKMGGSDDGLGHR